MSNLVIDGNSLKIEDLIKIKYNSINIVLSEKAKAVMHESRLIIENIIENDDVVYGVNTVFGSLSSVSNQPGGLGLGGAGAVPGQGAIGSSNLKLGLGAL